ncbi:MAG: tetratricopeptide repeat protein [Bacteroidota bacterium]
MKELIKKIAKHSQGYYIIVALLLSLSAFGQEERKYIREGNDYYKEQDFEKARQSYLKGIEANADSYGAAFNLGDALYKDEKYEEATRQFEMLTQKATSPTQKSAAYHNLGNTLLESQKYEESIEAYKNALRNNPADEDARYNLAYAQQKLKEQQKQQQQNKNQDQENQDQQDQNQDQQNQENQEQNENQEQDQKSQQNQNQQQKNQEEQQNAPQPQKQGISKEDAERLLEALQNQEQELQEDMKKKKIKTKSAKVEKDW